jgi:hypothetical protein
MRALGLFVAGLIVGTGMPAVLAQRGDAPVLANITDPYMGPIELAELPAESLHGQAMERWAR